MFTYTAKVALDLYKTGWCNHIGHTEKMISNYVHTHFLSENKRDPCTLMLLMEFIPSHMIKENYDQIHLKLTTCILMLGILVMTTWFFIVFWKAGTGKTFLAKGIQSTLVGKKKTMFVTTSTGIAGR